MQLFDIVTCLQHKLARHSIRMVHLQLHGYRSDRFLSSHSVLPNLTLRGPGDRGQPLESLVFQAAQHSRLPLKQYNPWIF
jgi:hypothetical protein